VGIGLVGLAIALTVGQDATRVPALPVSVERIQRELKKAPPPEPQQPKLRFRVTIEGYPLKLRIPWDPAIDSAVPNYVRPSMPLYHHEFLLAVTPEAFRAGTLYPIALNAAPAVESVVGAIRGAIRDYREERARREVQEELRKFLEELEKRKKEER
jgi:hypothetical protein